MKEIFYYDELKFDDLNIDVDFIIKRIEEVNENVSKHSRYKQNI